MLRPAAGGVVVEQPGSIRRGEALTFNPEANVLMRPVIDAVSDTPAFKRARVLVQSAIS